MGFSPNPQGRQAYDEGRRMYLEGKTVEECKRESYYRNRGGPGCDSIFAHGYRDAALAHGVDQQRAAQMQVALWRSSDRKEFELMAKCPMCRKNTPVLHTSEVVRALAVEVMWKEFGVCIDCYDILDGHKRLVVGKAMAMLSRKPKEPWFWPLSDDDGERGSEG